MTERPLPNMKSEAPFMHKPGTVVCRVSLPRPPPAAGDVTSGRKDQQHQDGAHEDRQEELAKGELRLHATWRVSVEYLVALRGAVRKATSLKEIPTV